MVLYLGKNEAENLQNGDRVHLAKIYGFEMGYLENYVAH